jgi:hypothetical protein
MEVKENSKENQSPSEPKKAEAPGSCGKNTIKGRKVAAAKSRTKASTPVIPVETPELSLFRNSESTQYNTFSGTATPTRSSSQVIETLDTELVYKSLDDLSHSDGDGETQASAKSLEESTPYLI